MTAIGSAGLKWAGERVADMADHAAEPEGRTTAPQSEYTNRQVGIGMAVLVVGLLVAFGIPALVFV